MKKSKPFLHVASSGLMALGLSSLSLDAYSATRIVGGDKIDISDAPWQVYLDIPDGNGGYSTCGGTILEEKWILTAAHCFWGGDGQSEPHFLLNDIKETVVAIVGESIISEASAENQYEFTIDDHVYIHPDSVAGVLKHDIALIQLPSAMDLDRCGDKCKSVGLVTPSIADTTTPHSTRAYVSGWGNTVAEDENGNVAEGLQQIGSDQLKDLEVFIQSCGDEAEDYEDTVICAGAENMNLEDACQGDSGGPLVVQSTDGTETVLLAGVVSNGVGCAAGLPGHYTRVSAYSDWINERMSNADVAPSEVGGSTPNDDDSDTTPNDATDTENSVRSSDGGGGSIGLSVIALLAGLFGFRKRWLN
jgi:secreted trypsin-like serine protease